MDKDKKKPWLSILSIGILMAIFSGVIAIYKIGPIRFANPLVNYITMAVVFLLPLCCVFLLFFVTRKKIRICFLIILIPISLVSFLLFLGIQLDLLLKGPYAWKCIRQIDLGQQNVRVYRYNGGATTSYSIEVRKEKPLPLGLIYVECLYDEWGASDVGIERLKDICFGIDDRAITEEEFLTIFKKETDAKEIYTWLEIAKYEEMSGNYQDALTSIDKAIGNGRWWPPYIEKAHCIARNEGYEKAVAWFNDLIKESTEDPKYYYLLGQFNMERGKYQASIEPFTKSIDLNCEKHGFRFDENHWLILDEETLKKESNDFASLWPKLEYLSQGYFNIDDYENAWKYATMGVSIGQQLNRCKGYYNQAEIDAGDVDCRLIRAYVHMHKQQWEKAEEEIEKAITGSGKSNYIGWKRDIEQAKKALNAMRKDKSI